MRTLIKEIAIPAEAAEYLNMLSWETDGWSVLCAQITRSGEVSGENYQAFLDRFRDANFAFRSAFDTVLHTYADEYAGDGRYFAEVHFEHRTLAIYDTAEVSDNA